MEKRRSDVADAMERQRRFMRYDCVGAEPSGSGNERIVPTQREVRYSIDPTIEPLDRSGPQIVRERGSPDPDLTCRRCRKDPVTICRQREKVFFLRTRFAPSEGFVMQKYLNMILSNDKWGQGSSIGL